MEPSAHSTPIGKPTTSFLDEVKVDYGPRQVLSDFFAATIDLLGDHDLSVHFASPYELLTINKANSSSWRPLIGVFNPLHGGVNIENTFAVIARDAAGRAVAAHACRLFDWSGGRSFHSEAASLRMFYENPERDRLPNEECTITAERAKKISGQVVFSGAAWIHPDYRGKGLSHIFPKLGKAAAFTRFSPDYIASTMIEDIHQRGFAPKFDYTNVDWEIHLRASHMGDWRLAVVWMEGTHIVDVMQKYLGASRKSVFNVTAGARRG
jgi:hypothetical protein